MTHREATAMALLLLVTLQGCGTTTPNLNATTLTSHLTSSTTETPRIGDKEALDVQLAIARTLEKDEEHTAAANAYREILKGHPKSSVAFHRLAILHDRKGEFDKSEEFFKQALSLDEQNPELLCDFSYSLYLQERWGESEAHVRRALEMRPTHRRAHNQLGLLLAQQEEYDQAFTELRAAGCTTAEAHMNIAVVMTTNNRLFEARAQYQTALESEPASEIIRSRIDTLDRLLTEVPMSTGPAGVANIHGRG